MVSCPSGWLAAVAATPTSATIAPTTSHTHTCRSIPHLLRPPKIASSKTHLSSNALRALFAKATRMAVIDCLVTLGASGAAAQCGACSTLESGVVHVSGRHDTPRAMARQQERAFLRLYVPPGRGMTVVRILHCQLSWRRRFSREPGRHAAWAQSHPAGHR